MSASPQLEDGHVRIATELLLALALARMTARQWPIVMIIARKTYGYQKKVDDIGLSQLSELTGIAKPHVSVAVRELVARRILTRRVGQFGHILGINKNHLQWLPASKQVTGIPEMGKVVDDGEGVTESVTVTDSVTDDEGLPNRYEGGYRIGKAGVTESVTTIDNPTKENHQKKKSCASLGEIDPEIAIPAGRPGRATTDAKAELQNRFERFYEAYPKKRSRQTAEKAFARINPDEQLLAAILAGIERAMTSGAWTATKFIPHPATWLNAAGWQDEIQTAYSEAELTVIERFNEALGDRLGHVQTSPFLAERADAIRDFVTFSAKPGFVDRFFPWAGANVDFPPSVGFDWLISRKGYTNATSGQHTKRAP